MAWSKKDVIVAAVLLCLTGALLYRVVPYFQVFNVEVGEQAPSFNLTADDGSDTFEEDATWWIRPGLADESWISFEAYSRSGSYIGRMFGVLALIEPNDSTAERALADATFLEER